MGRSQTASELFSGKSRTNEVLAIKARSNDRIGGLSPERFALLRSLGQDPLLDYRTTLDRIYQESNDHLDVLAREVREGKNVLEASFFFRWLEFSGVLSLLEKHALPGQDFTPLRRKLLDLIGECGEHFRGGRVAPKYAESDITEIERKLDILLADKARSVPTITVVTTVKQVPNNGEALNDAAVVARRFPEMDIER